MSQATIGSWAQQRSQGAPVAESRQGYFRLPRHAVLRYPKAQ